MTAAEPLCRKSCRRLCILDKAAVFLYNLTKADVESDKTAGVESDKTEVSDLPSEKNSRRQNPGCVLTSKENVIWMII